MILTLYARREPTACILTGSQPAPLLKRQRDVVIYRDAAATIRAGRFMWASRDKPDRRHRWLTLNCYRWRLVWLPDLEESP